MDRRALLSSLAALSGGLAGCGAAGGDGDGSGGGSERTTTGARETATGTAERTTTTATTTTTVTPTTTVRPAVAHTVRIETSRVSGLTGRETRVVVGSGGRFAVVRICEGTTNTSERQLDPATHDALVRAALALDLEAMPDTYECTGDCPMDVPGKRFLVTVDGTQANVFVEAQAEGVPEELLRLDRQLRELRQEVGTPPCGTVTES